MSEPSQDAAVAIATPRTAPGRRYGLAAISRSLGQFMLGKAVAIIAATVTLFLLAAHLPPVEYAAYVALQALVVLIGRASGLGLQKVMLRYLPELHGTGDQRAAYRLLWQGTWLRALVVALALGAVALWLPPLAGHFELAAWLWLLPAYLLVGFVRLLGLWVSIMLESFLWQREAQYPFALAGLVKLALFLWLLPLLDLPLLILIELAVEGALLLLLVALAALRWRRDPQRGAGTADWFQRHRGRVLRFGFWGLLQSQSNLLYGSAPNRLVAAHYLPAAEVALYGMADNLMNLVRRVLPTQLFIGLLRPVMMARFAVEGDIARVAWIADLAYRLNLGILVLGLALVIPVGAPLLDSLTQGKYGAAAWLIAGLLVLVSGEAFRVVSELLAQAAERNQTLFITNLVLSASLFVALPLLPWLGVWALILANYLGTLATNLLTLWYLRRSGYPFVRNRRQALRLLGYGALAGALGEAVTRLGLPPWPSAVLIAASYAALLLWRPPLEPDERAVLRQLLARRTRRRAAAPVSARPAA